MDRIVILIYLICLYVFIAVMCAVLARSKGRNAIVAFILGLLFNVFALISYAGMGEAIDDEFLPPAEFDELVKKRLAEFDRKAH